MDKPKCWVKMQLKMKVEVGLQFKNLHFNPTFGFVHILLKFGFKQPSIVYSVVVFSAL